MECYFLFPKYDRSTMESILLDLGYQKTKRNMPGMTTFKYDKCGTVVNLTSPSEGIMQVQAYSANALDDITSLKDCLKPQRIVNLALDDLCLGLE